MSNLTRTQFPEVIPLHHERRRADRVNDELRMSLRFEVAWSVRLRWLNATGPARTADQLRAYKREFEAGWIAAYEDVFVKMRRDAASQVLA